MLIDATDIAEVQVILREIRDLLREQKIILRQAINMLETVQPRHVDNLTVELETEKPATRAGCR